jgi:hypothetical protein
MRQWRNSGARAAALGLLALTCTLSCDCGREDGDPVYYAGGITSDTRYESSELYGTWLHFPGGRRYRLLHGLGEAPTDVTVYLAFREDPLRENATGNVSTATGNVALIEAVTDEHVQVRNDTCSEYFVRVVAEVGSGSTLSSGGAGGAPAGAGGSGG